MVEVFISAYSVSTMNPIHVLVKTMALPHCIHNTITISTNKTNVKRKVASIPDILKTVRLDVGAFGC